MPWSAKAGVLSSWGVCFHRSRSNPKGPCTQIDILWPESSPYMSTLGPMYTIWVHRPLYRVGFQRLGLPVFCGLDLQGFRVKGLDVRRCSGL